jgi:nucleotide-binding universal stress UspA family protein
VAVQSRLPGNKEFLMKVLLATDGSPGSDAAVMEVAQRPWPDGSEIKVISAFELPLPPTPEAWAIPPTYFEELDSSARQQARSIVESAVEELKEKLPASISITGEIFLGPAKAVILEEAENWEADLIVLGSHGYRVWERFFLGSVSRAVVSHAKCSVEVVRSHLSGSSSNPSLGKSNEVSASRIF